MGARALNELRTMLALAVKQGAALAALGVAAGCAGKTERLDGTRDAGSTPNGGSTASGGSTSMGGDAGALGGSSPTGGRSTGGVTNVGGSAPTGGGGASGGSAGSGTGGDGSGGHPALAPYPLDDVKCVGPTYDGGYHGQCCFSARCYTPDAGACVAADQRPPIPLPSGSGSCGCSIEGVEVAALKGPYAPNPNGMASPEGSCCYLVGAIGCEGRPLIVEGTAIVAPLAARDDWCAAFA